ncbi:outer membrane lipoprotein LolB [Acidihalobacter yilgarnensis]|uniref:Outer-membrane lipoprotein LolB n=1 Tax=Acidihalobacter yilgarnensis TaxID=2819280 RepID=A0A1D8IKF9_9GAMM|nr:lipoprotein insertase outer membrane protein LolB [Acidihalobacter yilgarnensis]AOU96927.1 outer membrane lipoprotein LolB [Acidihalobacter yilgarnensis]
MNVLRGVAVTMTLALILAGCASVPQRSPGELEGAWRRHEAAILANAQWSLDGSFGLKIGRRGWSAGLRWRQAGERYHIDIYDPLGRTVAVLAGRPGDVTLDTDRDKSYRASSAAKLMTHALGWSLPVSGLRYWVRGVPVPDEPIAARQLDGSGRLSRLQQDGWTVRYQDYDYDTVNARPTRMVMTRGDVRLVVVVNQWGDGS